jgi:hypothetical protein
LQGRTPRPPDAKALSNSSVRPTFRETQWNAPKSPPVTFITNSSTLSLEYFCRSSGRYRLNILTDVFKIV